MRILLIILATLMYSAAHAEPLPPCSYEQLESGQQECNPDAATLTDKTRFVDERIQSVAVSDPADVRNFMTSLRTAVLANDANAIAKMIHWPLRYVKRGKPTLARNPIEFRKNFTIIFSEKVKLAILNQRYEDLFVNTDGIMYGDGQVWLHPFYENGRSGVTILRIETVNN